MINLKDIPTSEFSETIPHIQRHLIQMGFEINTVNKLLKHFHITSIDKAIDYLIKSDDGKWNHPFVSKTIFGVSPENSPKSQELSNNFKEICDVCQGTADEHNFILNEKNNNFHNHDHLHTEFSNRPISKKLSEIGPDTVKYSSFKTFDFHIKDKKSLNFSIIEHKDKKEEIRENNNNLTTLNVICEVCYINDFDLEMLPCKEKICKQCITEYLHYKISNSDVENIKCPNHKCCKNYIFTEEVLLKFVDDKHFAKYKKFLRKINLLKNSNVYLCPIADCDSFGYKIPLKEEINTNTLNINDPKPNLNANLIVENNPNEQKENIGKCQNNHEFCLKCNQRPHPNMDCENQQEKDFSIYVHEEKIKNCPECKFYIKKFQGCNHIQCGNPICKYEFCWICLEKYSVGHYNSPTSNCYKLQYSEETDFFVRFRTFRRLRICLIWSWRILLGLIICLLPTLLGSLFMLYEINVTERYLIPLRRNSKCLKFLIKTIHSFTAVLIGIYTIPLGYFLFFTGVACIPIILVISMILLALIPNLMTRRRNFVPANEEYLEELDV
jgi:hypothetical protein